MEISNVSGRGPKPQSSSWYFRYTGYTRTTSVYMYYKSVVSRPCGNYNQYRPLITPHTA